MSASATPLISIVICTHNRCRQLLNAIESIVNQPSDGVARELIVVDNQSTDTTRESVRRLERLGMVRYVHEPMLGLCHARNTGWQSARGRYVAYLDDDATAEPGWLESIRDAFAYEPEAGVVGGKVEPIWGAERPAWLSDQLSLSLTILDWSKRPTCIVDLGERWLVGANMAMPRSVLEEVGGFDTRLDRVGAQMLSGGDVFLQKQILRLGYRCLYYPAMAIRHFAPETRLQKRWFRKRYYWQGVSDAVVQLIEESPSSGRRLKWAARRSARFLRSRETLARLLWPTDDPEQFYRNCLTWIELGHIAGLLGAARR